MTVLEKAAAANKDRAERYGHPFDHFSRTVKLINVRFAHKLKEPLSPLDWPLMMELDKIARGDDTDAKQNDDDTDIAGYANARGIVKCRMQQRPGVLTASQRLAKVMAEDWMKWHHRPQR